MLKSEMQHQYWVTKKTVQRKLGGKEDECVVSSDAELDAKIELFKSITDTCVHLYRVIDHYQERVCILAQEENALGKFLKENGKLSTTSSKVMISAGKAISYCGQQRMTVRSPLVRLHHEVETFRCRAIADTQATIAAMERERTEYRAALSWMKSASAQLDPDSGKGLEKFRKAQNHVRLAKQKFDRLTLDCLQKIDLLAAARCNMFSHALVSYQSSLLQFANKTWETFKAAAKILENEPHYNFCILKELTQANKEEKSTEIDSNSKQADTNEKMDTVDTDQMLFFQDEYKDEYENQPKKIENDNKTETANKNEFNSAFQLIDIGSGDVATANSSDLMKTTTNLLEEISSSTAATSSSIVTLTDIDTNEADLLGLASDFGDFMSAKPPSFMPSQLLLDDLATLNLNDNTIENINSADEQKTAKVSSILNLFNKIPINPNNKNNAPLSDNATSTNPIKSPKIGNKDKIARKDMSAWFQIFAELDPLANPDAMSKQIDGVNNSHAA